MKKLNTGQPGRVFGTMTGPMENERAEHTPGPWHKGDGKRGDWIGIGNGSAAIAKTLVTQIVGWEEARANARLIAAAPELLEMLKQRANITGAKGMDRTVVASIVARAWKTIAKAEGK